MLKLTKNQIGALEERLFLGGWNYEDIDILSLVYKQQHNLAQWSRINEIKSRSKKQQDSIDLEKIFLKKDTVFSHSQGLLVFPFTTQEVFFDKSEQYTFFLLCYLLKESLYKELIIDNEISKEFPKVVSLLVEICNIYNKKYTLLGYTPNAFIIDANDKKYVHKLLEYPTEIAISPLTGPYNIACRFCEQAYTKIPYQEMSFDIFCQAIDCIPKNIPTNINLTPFLEPLSKKIFFSYLEYIAKTRSDIHVLFNTNGVLLTEKVSRLFVDIGLKEIIISLNMPDAFSYRQFVGFDYFDKVVANIETLCRIKKEKNSLYPKVIVQYLNDPPPPPQPPIPNLYYEQIFKRKAFLRERWANIADAVSFRNISPPINDPNRLAEFKNIYPDMFLEQTVKPEKALPCMSTMTTLVIDYKGYYLPCCAIRRSRTDSNKRKHKFLEIGHIDNMDVVTAWHSKKLQQIRAWNIAGLINICNNCTLNQSNLLSLYSLKNGIVQACYLRYE